eukprot:NODE_4388_length_816_cov_8.683181_g4058_i0.p2 GENE.NODE_4388_length_816_cov_8.683181_g4058_i0~~NODE_4388_length_816_cov_8.683181_g4058_i0.p2  ORF type:complete len:191 (+),score=19.21 NODE_4388_length_816_cov_8.683181_g4058_i0:80-652(+)
MSQVFPEGSSSQRVRGTNHADPSSIRVVHHAGMSDKFRRFLLIQSLVTCGCLNVDAAMERAYFEVQENRVEFNQPLPCLCGVADRVSVIFYDRDVAQNVGRASALGPDCSHFHICPTAFDLCGEGIVFYSDNCSYGNQAILSQGRDTWFPCQGFFLCRQYTLLCGFANADVLVEEIRKAKAQAVPPQAMS